MKARCPNNPEHLRFVTVAHVSQDWMVDQDGIFLDEVPGECEVVAKPDKGNTWTCVECGAEAIVTDD